MTFAATYLGLFFIQTPLLFILEFYLCKKNSKWAKILPIIEASFFIFFGLFALINAGVMFGIYHIMKSKQDKQDELEKMNIQDL